MSAILTAGISSLVLNISAPLDIDGVTPRDDLIGVKVWISQVSNFLPPSEGTLVFDGSSLSITIPGLTTGITYYVKYALISEIDPDNYIVSTSYSAIPLASTYIVDSTAPPTPTGTVLSAGITSIIVQHDNPVYTQGHGHKKTYVFGVKYTNGALPVFSDAVLIDQFTGTTSTIGSDPATTWRVWLKWESIDGVLSTIPAGGTNGFTTTTGQDVSKLLTAISGAITTSELATNLNTRINLIDASSAVVGSVNARLDTLSTEVDNQIQIETSALANSIINLQTSVNNQIDSEVTALENALQIESHTRMVDVQTAATAALNAVTAINTEQLARTQDIALARSELTQNLSSGLSAEAAQRTTLAAQIHGGYSGNDLNQVTTGLLYQERLARSNQDSALALQITLLSAGVGEQFDWKDIWYFDSTIEGWGGNGAPSMSEGFIRPAISASDPYVVSPSSLDIDSTKYNQVRFRIRKVGSPVFDGYFWWNNPSTSWDNSRRVVISTPTFDANGIALCTLNMNWGTAGVIDQVRLDLSSSSTSTDYFEIDWFAIGRPSPAASSAQIYDEQVARATADAAEVTSRDAISTLLFGATDPSGKSLENITSGLIYDEKVSRVSADSSINSSLTSLNSEVVNLTGVVSSNSSSITELNSTVASLSGSSSLVQVDLRSVNKKLDVDAETALRNIVNAEQSKNEYISEIALARQELKTDIVSGISAEAASRLQLEVQVDSNQANLVNNYYTKATVDSSIAASSLTLETEIDTNQSNLTNNYYTKSVVDSSIAASALTLDSKIDTNQANLTNNYYTKSVVDSSIAASSLALETEIDATQANLTNNYYTKATVDSSIAASALTLQTQVDTNQANLTNNYYTKSVVDSSIAASALVLQSQVDENSSDIVALNNTTSSLVGSTATSNLELKSVNKKLDTTAETALRTLVNAEADKASQVQEIALARQELKTDIVSGISAEAASRLQLEVQVNSNQANLVNNYYTKATVDSSIAASALTLQTQVDANQSNLTNNYYTKSVVDSSIAASALTLDSKIDANQANLTNNYYTKATVDSSIASSSSFLRAYSNINSKTFNQSTAPTIRGTDPQTSVSIPLQVGDLWIDTSNANEQKAWNGSAWVSARDGTIAAVDARVTSVETTQIGYCIISGSTSDYKTRSTCEGAGGTWVVGLPLASAVKQVQVTSPDGATATIQDTTSAQASLNTGLKAQKVIKLDVNGHVSGYGAYADASGGSEFIANVGRFAVTTPSDVIPIRTTSTAYNTGVISRVVGSDSKTLVCKATGITSSSALDISSYDVGAVFTDGSVIWQVASRVPFSVLSAPTSINGLTVPAGIYMDAAYILNGTVQNSQIGNGVIDSAKISDAAITTAKIGDAAITSAKIGTAQINTAHIGTLNASAINAGFISADRIQVGTATVSALTYDDVSAFYPSSPTNYPYVVSPSVNFTSTGSPLTLHGICNINVNRAGSTCEYFSFLVSIFASYSPSQAIAAWSFSEKASIINSQRFSVLQVPILYRIDDISSGAWTFHIRVESFAWNSSGSQLQFTSGDGLTQRLTLLITENKI